MKLPFNNFPDFSSPVQIIFLIVIVLALFFVIPKVWHIIAAVAHYIVHIIVILILLAICLCLGLLVWGKYSHASLPPAHLAGSVLPYLRGLF